MSDLKDLGFAVQEKVPPADFDQLVRRGRRRRAKHQALLAAGAAGAAAFVAAAVLIPNAMLERSTDRPPIASVPTTAPTIPGMAKGHLTGVAMSAPDRWTATWQSCKGETCTFAAKVVRESAAAITAVHTNPVHPLTFLDPRSSHYSPEPIAVAVPGLVPEGPNDPAWSKTELLRLSPSGPVRKPVRYAGSTATFGIDEIVSDQLIAGELAVLDVPNATLRILDLPADLGTSGQSPVEDDGGRLWLTASRDDGSGYVAWTEDGGKTWSKHLVDAKYPASKVAVSPDGRTIVANSAGDGTTPEAIVTMVMSTDGGVTWRKSKPDLWGRVDGPVVVGDGKAILLAQKDPDKPGNSTYLIDRDGTTTKTVSPPGLTSLAGRDSLLYGQISETTITVSVDGGRTWSTREPR